MARILLIGPIEDLGGRELEAGFAASVLHYDFEVDVLSTGNITDRSQIYEMVGDIKMRSLKQLLFKRYAFLRPAALLSYLRNNKKEPVYFYINNRVNSRFLKLRENEILKDVLINYDLIFIIAHLETLRTKEIIKFSKLLKKPVIFRTTGEIELTGEVPSYLKDVDLFIHHSIINANNLHPKLNFNNYTIIDQNSYMEEGLLGLDLPKRKVNRFITVARLAPEKNLFNLISFFEEFSDENDELTIVGTGRLYSELLAKSRDIKNIKLMGHLNINEVKELYRDIECAIIPAYTEAGPLVGIDAMAAGKIILSTEVGAMPERLANTNNDFWFEADNGESFKKQFEKIKNLTDAEVYRISEQNRNTYIERYSKTAVSKQYYKCITDILKNNSKVCL
ncbi:glycosyltransferase family 4 protein [Salegentibacter sp. F14]